MPLPTKVKRRIKKTKRAKPTGPLWKGPEEEGVTQSLLGRFLGCKERFKLQVIDGIGADRGFAAPLQYGHMWHECEEGLAYDGDWEHKLHEYHDRLQREFKAPNDRKDITKWFNVCKTQFPHYVSYWEEHDDEAKRTPIYQEETFCVPYELPSGRIVKLRGKWDSVDRIGRSVYLQENKTKGDINEQKLVRQLSFDLQTMFYFIALQENKGGVTKNVKGVRYNVIRRPLSGGKGSIRPHKQTAKKPAETMESFYERLEQYFIDDPGYWFMRWKVNISKQDVQRFKDDFLDPCLEHLCMWYEYVTGQNIKVIQAGPQFPYLHYRFPYGVWNPLTEGKGTDVDEYLATGSTVGLKRIENLFPELEAA